MPSIVGNHDYPGYEALGDIFRLSSATSLSLGDTTIVSISGQVSDSSDGSHGPQLEGAFKNVEKALSAARPDLSSTDIWEGIYNITSYHVGQLSQEDQMSIAEVAQRWLKKKVAWMAVSVVALFPPNALVQVQVQAAYKKG